MSALFKAPSIASATFNDTELRKMSELWNGNGEITAEAVKDKWKGAMGEADAMQFVKRLRQTVTSHKERIKRLYRVDPDLRDKFEQDMADTVKALEQAFTYN